LRKFLAGLAAGLILTTTTFVFAANPIKLIVNGNELHPDVPPQIIDGRTLVPARALAEALGASVEWDGVENAVVVTSSINPAHTNQDLSQPSKILKKGDSFETSDGLIFSIQDFKQTDSFKLESRNGSVFKGDTANTQLFITTIKIKNPTSVYEEIGIDLANDIFKLQPLNYDGREWYIKLFDIDYSKLSDNKYLLPGSEIKANLIWNIPKDLKIDKIIILKSHLKIPVDLGIDLN